MPTPSRPFCPRALLTAVEHLVNPRSDPLLVESHRQVWLDASECDLRLLAAALLARIARATRAIRLLGVGILGCIAYLATGGVLPWASTGAAATLAALVGLYAAAAVLATQRAVRREQLDALEPLVAPAGRASARAIAGAETNARVHRDDVLARRRGLCQLDLLILQRVAHRARDVRGRTAVPAPANARA